jgi:hypothetical protein
VRSSPGLKPSTERGEGIAFCVETCEEFVVDEESVIDEEFVVDEEFVIA